jgi:hypothetical protein
MRASATSFAWVHQVGPTVRYADCGRPRADHDEFDRTPAIEFQSSNAARPNS